MGSNAKNLVYLSELALNSVLNTICSETKMKDALESLVGGMGDQEKHD